MDVIVTWIQLDQLACRDAIQTVGNTGKPSAVDYNGIDLEIGLQKRMFVDGRNRKLSSHGPIGL